MHSFHCVVLDLYIVSVCEHREKLQILLWSNSAAVKNLGSAFYVDKQLMVLFMC